MEQVPECQTPFFLKAEVEPQWHRRRVVRLPSRGADHRAFAGILSEGLDGATAEQVLAVPADLYQRMGLATAISPLRVRGGTAILNRLQRQVREQLVARETTNLKRL